MNGRDRSWVNEYQTKVQIEWYINTDFKQNSTSSYVYGVSVS